jgi:hypothetical protein
MYESVVRRMLEAVASGRMPADEAVRELKFLPYADLGFARVDHHREMRTGVAEAVYGPGKTPEQVAAITRELTGRTTGAVLVTRATPEQFEAVAGAVPEAVWHESSRLIVARAAPGPPLGVAAVVSAGTSDLPVADEAAETAEAMAVKVERITDVGVAGLHRLIASHALLERAEVVIAVAGMDGALPALIAGMGAVPVIAVPTSVGYGAGAGGIAALLTMLNACAPGVAVVNIDNGFGAGVLAALILRRRREGGPMPGPASETSPWVS